jgi:hypothetical protein
VQTDSVRAQQALTAITTDKASVCKSSPPGRKTGFYEKVINVKADVAAVLISATQRFGEWR